MKSYVFVLAFTLVGCGGGVVVGDAERADRAPAPAPAEQGMACASLHGEATLSSYHGDNYASSAFSFEYASQDAELTRNEFDVVYEDDIFVVNTVTDDRSTIVDLGNVRLADVPRTVDVESYPRGEWGEHDALQASIGHTYYVRSVDGAGRLVAAFRVIGLVPGVRATIEWVRSTDSDAMVVSTTCGL